MPHLPCALLSNLTSEIYGINRKLVDVARHYEKILNTGRAAFVLADLVLFESVVAALFRLSKSKAGGRILTKQSQKALPALAFDYSSLFARITHNKHHGSFAPYNTLSAIMMPDCDWIISSYEIPEISCKKRESNALTSLP